MSATKEVEKKKKDKRTLLTINGRFVVVLLEVDLDLLNQTRIVHHVSKPSIRRVNSQIGK